MKEKICATLERLSADSRAVLFDYIKEHVSFRFFSYGSNMNESKFLNDTKRCNHKFGLKNISVGILKDYERVLGNSSRLHGLAFTIVPAEGKEVQGICHDVPIEGLEAFLRKEGVLCGRTRKPAYEIISVTVSGENQPVLTLIGLKPSNMDNLETCEQKLRLYHYLSATIEGAENWDVDSSEISKMRDDLEKDVCESASVD